IVVDGAARNLRGGGRPRVRHRRLLAPVAHRRTTAGAAADGLATAGAAADTTAGTGGRLTTVEPAGRVHVRLPRLITAGDGLFLDVVLVLVVVGGGLGRRLLLDRHHLLDAVVLLVPGRGLGLGGDGDEFVALLAADLLAALLFGHVAAGAALRASHADGHCTG